MSLILHKMKTDMTTSRTIRKRTNLPTKDKPKVLLYIYTLYRKLPLKEDNFSTKDKMAGPKCVLITEVPLYREVSYFKGK